MDVSFDFNRRIERRGTSSYKWDDNERLFGRANLLPFWVADMDFATPQPILDAIISRCTHPVLGYGIRSEEYFSAIRDWLRKRHEWEVPREWLMFCPPSSIVAIHGLVTALTAAGDSIVAPTPTYGPLLRVIAHNERLLLRNPLREENGRYSLDVDDLQAKIEAGTRLVMLCSPNNPVGRVFTPAELQALAQVAEERDLVVISDEVHCDLALPGHRHIPYGKIGGERSVTVISPNKTFNTAGIPQCTVIVPDENIRRRFKAFIDKLEINHDSTFGAEGMLAGYRHCAPWLDEMLEYVAGNHRYVTEFLAANLPEVGKIEAEATYLGWLDFRRTGMSQDALMDRLVNRGRVGLYSGTDFGPEGRGFFRMNLACPRALLDEGLRGIEKALK